MAEEFGNLTREVKLFYPLYVVLTTQFGCSSREEKLTPAHLRLSNQAQNFPN
jgi:hypothetical protein